jgi:NADP-dependent 3-hydroxy acid dehydrogenase YdfG
MEKKKLLLVGSTGVIGTGLKTALAGHYDIVTAGLAGEDITLDVSSAASISQALKQAGAFDALVSTAGRAKFAPLAGIEAAEFNQSAYALGLMDKLFGQVNLALAARACLNPNGCIVLTSGTTSETPIIGGSSLSMVNGGLDAWVRAAATELPNGLRINSVSPSLVEGTPATHLRAFPGFDVVPMRQVALAYLRCLQSGISGQVIRV